MLHPKFCMLLLFLEALGALLLLLFIVWWTMFSGRDKGELPEDRRNDGPTKGAAPNGGQVPDPVAEPGSPESPASASSASASPASVPPSPPPPTP